MKCVAAIAAVIGLAVTVPASAQTYGLDPPAVAAMPPAEIVTIVRAMGFLPISRPVLRGNVYILRAADDDDLPVRVMVDARTGEVVAVNSARLLGPRYGGLPDEFDDPVGRAVPYGRVSATSTHVTQPGLSARSASLPPAKPIAKSPDRSMSKSASTPPTKPAAKPPIQSEAAVAAAKEMPAKPTAATPAPVVAKSGAPLPAQWSDKAASDTAKPDATAQKPQQSEPVPVSPLL